MKRLRFSFAAARHVLALFALIAGVHCGPGKITPPTPLPADIFAVGPLTQSGCDAVSCASATFDVQNTGQGCALTGDMSGTVGIYTRDGNFDVKLTETTWELTASDKATGVFRPADVRHAVAGSMLRNPGGTTYRITVRQTPVRCP